MFEFLKSNNKKIIAVVGLGILAICIKKSKSKSKEKLKVKEKDKENDKLSELRGLKEDVENKVKFFNNLTILIFKERPC